jgi:predicted ester cyclase
MMNQDITIIKQLLDRNIKALNAKDIQGVLANQQPDAELVVGGGLTLRGHEQLKQYTEALWTAFPDGAFSHTGQVLADDAAAAELVFTGTHTGPLATPNGAIPPTGKHVTLHSASIMRFKDGLIASEHAYTDQVEFMTQLGLMPASPGPTSEQ